MTKNLNNRVMRYVVQNPLLWKKNERRALRAKGLLSPLGETRKGKETPKSYQRRQAQRHSTSLDFTVFAVVSLPKPSEAL